MRKLKSRMLRVMRIAIQQEIGRSEESRYDHRLHGIAVGDGRTILPRSRGVALAEWHDRVQRWVSRFEQAA